MAVALSIPITGGLGQSLIPEMHQGRFTAEIALPVGTPLPVTLTRVSEIEAKLQDQPDIVHIHTVVGTERRADSQTCRPGAQRCATDSKKSHRSPQAKKLQNRRLK